nr:MAG TPA_asm: FIBRITIN T4, STRUCTURAL PROTEIN, CHAPERONE.85A [Bacteriophage sp.]
MENIDIKDFQSVSAVAELDNILLVQSSGVNGKMTVSLFKTAIKNDVTPSIQEGVWWIGTVNTGVTAAGKTPEFRKGDLGIEWKYTTDTSWKLLVNYESISLTFDDLTEEQKDSLKLHFSDLTPAEIAELQQPAQDMIAELEATNTNVTNAEDLRVAAETKRQADTAAAIKSATDAASAANTAAENVQDGKTPALEIGTVQEGASASATVTADGTDAAGNPKYKINLVLPKGNPGDDGKTPVLEIGTVQEGTSASATVTADGTDAAGNPKYKISLVLPKGGKGDTGKTPVLEIGTVTKGESASASVTADGTDAAGNPKYKINLTLPQGDQGDPGNDGMDGKTPVLEIGSTVTGDPGTQASATLTANGTTAEGNPKYVLSLTIPRGDKGLPGEGSGNVSASGTGLVAGKQYLFVPSSNGSTEGTFVEYTEPEIPEQVQPDWNATSGKGAILNKPTIPTKVSQLTNDSNYASKTYVDEEIGKIPTPDVSAQIETHNASETAHPYIRNLITSYLSTAKGYTDEKIAALIGTAPEILDTLGELADAIVNNQEAVAAINDAIAQKLGKTEAQSLYVALQGYIAYSQEEKTKLAGIQAGANYFPDAPSDDKQYGRKNGQWAQIEASSSGTDFYDATWLFNIMEDGTCTQEQYNGLSAAISQGTVNQPTKLSVYFYDDNKTIIRAEYFGFNVGNKILYGYSWTISPDLSVTVLDSIVNLTAISPVAEYPVANSDGSVNVNLFYGTFFIVTGATRIVVNDINLRPGQEGSFQFTCGSTAATLSMPSYIKWINEPVIEANKTYQVSILNDIAVIGGVE